MSILLVLIWVSFLRRLGMVTVEIMFTLLFVSLERLSVAFLVRQSLRDFLVWEMHAGGLAGHFGREFTIALVSDGFYWPSLKRDLSRILSQCRTG